MSNGILSQEEIDALLRGESPSHSHSEGMASVSSDEQLNEMEIDALGEISNIAMGTSATTLSTLLGKRVSITTPRVIQTTRQKVQAEHQVPYVVVIVEYSQGLEGANLLVVKTEDAAVIADLMMGRDGTDPIMELDEILLSAISEAMNQMMGSATTSLSTMFNKRIDISPPILEVIALADTNLQEKLSYQFDNLVKISFRMVIENLVDSEIMQLIPILYAKELVENLLGGMSEPPVETTPSSSGPDPVPPVSQPVAAAPTTPVPEIPNGSMPLPGPASPPPSPLGAEKKPTVPVQSVQFTSLSPAPREREIGNISLIMDVPLEISVELGRTRKTIKEILEMGPGSIIQLDRLAGEPVDLLVNGKLVARGEVVVIDENFGIRVTSIVSQMERITNLQ